MAVYERSAGDHVAERVQPEPGSDREKELERLAKDDASDWHHATGADPEPAEPKRPAKTDNKAAWVDWAVSQGSERYIAEAGTKDDLIKAYGG